MGKARRVRIARRKAKKYGVDPDIFVRQIAAENNFKVNGGSPAGAQDIAQFMPSTAAAYGVTLHDGKVKDDLDGAARYMRDNLKASGGDYKKALSLYNSGKSDGYLRFGETKAYVAKILDGQNPSYGDTTSKPSSTGGPRDRTTTLTSTVPDTQARNATRRTAALSYLQESNSPDALLNLATSLRDAVQTTTTTTVTKDQVGGDDSGSPSGDGGYLGKVEHRANRIDKHHFPYQWGGGHNAATQHKAIPLDCSGAVSKVLGLDPRVASQFKSFGRSGKGKHITIYAKDDHVLMSINGKFWGTSGSNPGGGAGWIPASAVSSSYLSGFVARHPKGL